MPRSHLLHKIVFLYCFALFFLCLTKNLAPFSRPIRSKSNKPYFGPTPFSALGLDLMWIVMGSLNLPTSLWLAREIERRSRCVMLPWKQNFWMTTNRKSHFKSVHIVSNFIDLIQFPLIFKCWRNFLGLNPKGPYLILGKENFCVLFTYSIKRPREITKFHVAAVQQRLRNVQIAW